MGEKFKSSELMPIDEIVKAYGPNVDALHALIARLADGVEAAYQLVNDLGLEGDAAQCVEDVYHDWMLADYTSPEVAEAAKKAWEKTAAAMDAAKWKNKK